jgi:hypothetical protein
MDIDNDDVEYIPPPQKRKLPAGKSRCMVLVEPVHKPWFQKISTERIKEILTTVGEAGVSIKEACRMHDELKNYRNVLHRIYNSPELAALDSKAREHYLQLQVRRMNEIAADTSIAPDRARLMCDNIKWESARVMPHQFGDKIIHSGDKDNPIVVKMVADSDELLKKLQDKAA